MLRIITISFVLFVSLISFGQTNKLPIEFIALNNQNGLSSNEVNCIQQDNKGFVWFGTNNGLCRYDGYEFVTYKSNYLTPNLLQSNSIRSMAIDSMNRIWLGTTSGLDVFDTRTGIIKKYTLKELYCNKILQILITRKNAIYFGTDNGLRRFNSNKEKFENLNIDSKKDTISGYYVKSLLEDNKGIIWVGTWMNGFCTFDPSTNSYTKYPSTSNGMKVSSFFEDRDNNIWLGEWEGNGLRRIVNPYSPTEIQFINYSHDPSNSNSLSENIIYSITQDDKFGYIWVATPSGLNVLTDLSDPLSFIKYTQQNTNDAIKNNEIYSLAKDNIGNIWLSVFGNGICQVKTKTNQFQNYSIPTFNNITKSNVVNSVYDDNGNYLWLGVKSIGLVIYNKLEQKYYHYSQLPVLNKLDNRTNSAMSIIKSRITSDIWIATRYNGVSRIERKNDVPIKISNFNYNNTPLLKTNNSFAICEDLSGNIWVGNEKGISLLAYNKQAKQYELKVVDVLEKQIFIQVQSIFVDSKGVMWLGTAQNGIFKVEYNAQLLTNFRIKKYETSLANINGNDIQCFHEDVKGRLWVGTQGGGLSSYDAVNDRFSIIENMHLFPDDAVYSIQEDKFGRLWLGTGNGLVCYGPDLKLDRQIKVYSEGNGIHNNSFIRNASNTNSKGEIFMGGYNGFISFMPDNFKENLPTLAPVITDVLIFNKSISLLDSTSETSKYTPPFTNQINLKYSEKSVTIEFASLNFNHSTSNKYAYMIEGIDADWIYTDGMKRSVSYNNLGQGKYIFKVKSTNLNGDWGRVPTTLVINVLPAPWFSIWALILYLILFVVFSFFIQRIIFNRFRLINALKIEQIERKKSEEVNQAKLKFFTNVSHELFTPLTILMCSLEDLMTFNAKDHEIHNTMKNNLMRLMRLLQQILEFRKAESGNLKLKVAEGDLVSFTRQICDEAFNPLANSRKIQLNFSTTNDKIIGYFDHDKLDKIMYNLLSNAFKYNTVGGNVSVELSEFYKADIHYASIVVADSGQGIATENLTTLFNRFYEGDYRRFKTTGTGIGLSLTKDLVELHSGQITVDSVVSKGTTFSVVIPIDRNYFALDQIDSDIEDVEDENLFKNNVLQRENVIASKLEVVEHVKAKPTILIVEDNKELIQVMVRILSLNYNVLTANNGQEGLEIVLNNEIDLIVTDLKMPVMDGFEMCKALKNDLKTSHLPIIMLSAKTSVDDKIEGFESGADVYITKPFELSALSANIKSLIENRQRIAGNFRNSATLEPSTFAFTCLDEEFLNRAMKVVEEHLSDSTFDTEAFFINMNMTQSTLYRKLKSLTGMSPTEFIRNVRFKTACQILIDKPANISEVAYAVGFNDPKYFSNSFKKEVGMSPSDFVKKNRLRANSADDE